jgi:GNAT superfamily N-acetyltransferase
MDFTDAQLLERELDAIFGLQEGPGAFPLVLDPTVRVALGWSPSAFVLAVSPEVELDATTIEGDEPYRPGAVPRVISTLAERLGRTDADGEEGPAPFKGGPSFVIPPDVVGPAVDLPIVASDESGMTRAASFERPDNWGPDEWLDLTQGRIGEWAMAIHEREPVSICHTPAATPEVAEAGVWTREDFRGRGLARATLVPWARRERNNKEVLFYSTWADNLGSLYVASKLRLRPLGWIWIIT